LQWHDENLIDSCLARLAVSIATAFNAAKSAQQFENGDFRDGAAPQPGAVDFFELPDQPLFAG